MLKTPYTEEQLSAIRTRDKTLLVSAAAGAGKTATLTERIMCSLIGKRDPNEKMDPDAAVVKPENINEMLIVTFTKAAAAELRERIGEALKRAVAECHTGPYLAKIYKDIEEKIAKYTECEPKEFEAALKKLLYACPSPSIQKDIVDEALDLKEKYSGRELCARIAEMIRETGGSCNPVSIIPKLEEQLYLLPSARISTIDSFCYEIMKNNAEKCGVPPRCRIADKIEASVLEHSLWTERIDAAFEGMIDGIAPEEFEELAVSLTGVKSDKALEESFEFLYDKSKSSERGVKLFTDIREMLDGCKDKALEDIPYVAHAMTRAKESAEYHANALFIMMKNLHGSDIGIDDRLQRARNKEEYILAETEIINASKDTKASKGRRIDALGIVEFEDKILLSMDSDRKILKAIIDAKTYEEMKAALSQSFAEIPSPRKKFGEEKTPESIEYQFFRDSFMKKDLLSIKNNLFAYSRDEWFDHVGQLARLVRVMERFIQSFDEIYFKEKIKRGMLEFSDVSRKVFELLYDSDGKPSSVAISLRDQFSSVYIDEYQDVNAVQNKIFIAISKPTNRFTVGDIKQSIYGFRSARPDIFKDMKGALPKLGESDRDGASVFMSKNFRCDEKIIDFINEIFDPMFTLSADSLGYTPDDKLAFAKKYKKGEAPNGAIPEVMLFAAPKKTKRSADDEANTDEDAEEETETSALSPMWVRDKVKELIDKGMLNNGKNIKPKDIAILLRKDKGRSLVYKDALEEIGICAATPDTKSFFLNGEIQLALCLLNTINNPLKDIYLAGAMLSPLFGFTPTELYEIKRGSQSALWYKVAFRGGKDFSDELAEKCKKFVETVRKYRTISEGMRVDELILRLYNETGLLALGLGSGCKENLMLLYNYAKDFEASSYEGLYSFINYINTVIEEGGTFQTKKQEGETGAVTIMTVHSSKGLEFPVVILADASTPLISQTETAQKIGYNENMGIGFKTRYKNSIALVDSPVRRAIIDSNAKRSIEEELRIYYVALTRAREQLYIVGAPEAKSKDDYLIKANIRKKFRTPYLFRQAKTFVDILHAVDNSAIINWQDPDKTAGAQKADTPPESEGGCEDFEPKIESAAEATELLAAVAEEAKHLYELAEESRITEEERMAEEARKAEEARRAEEAKKAEERILAKALEERFGYVYPEEHLTRLPEKMSISRLSPRLLDSDEDSDEADGDPIIEKVSDGKKTHSLDAKRKRLGTLPKFYTGDKDDDSAKRGIATHNVLQFMNIERLCELGSEAEIEALKKDGFLSEADAKRVLIEEIEAFKNSELLASMRKASKEGRSIWREFRFSVLLPAPLFAESKKAKELYKDEKILLQGIIDCLYEDENGRLHLVDYKTDRIKAGDNPAKKLSVHKTQLTYYAIAVKRIFGRFPDTISIYSLPLGRTVEITPDKELEEFKTYDTE